MHLLTIILHDSVESITQRIDLGDWSECDCAMDVSNILSDHAAGMLMGKDPQQNMTYIFIGDGNVIASALMVWDEDGYTDGSDESWRRMCERISDSFDMLED